MKLILFLFAFCYLIQSGYTQSECIAPWQKVNDDICVYLTSATKPWNQAKFLCKFHGGELLFIQNKEEQDILTAYLSKLIKHRFNNKNYIWIDAIDPSQDGRWIWSSTNRSVTYSNWSSKSRSTSPKSDGQNCACLKVKDGSWKECDCILREHYVCRRPTKQMNETINSPAIQDEINIDMRIIRPDTTKTTEASTSTTTTTETTTTTMLLVIEETPDMAFVAQIPQNKSTVKTIGRGILPPNKDEEKAIIVSSILDNVDRGSDESDIMLDLDISQSLLKKSESSGQIKTLKFRRPVNSEDLPLLIRRNTYERDSDAMNTYYCSKGPGYYIVQGTECKKFKKCETLDEKQNVVTVYKCPRHQTFDIDEQRCSKSAGCDTKFQFSKLD